VCSVGSESPAERYELLPKCNANYWCSPIHAVLPNPFKYPSKQKSVHVVGLAICASTPAARADTLLVRLGRVHVAVLGYGAFIRGSGLFPTYRHLIGNQISY
jgi:hypothetical protein